MRPRSGFTLIELLLVLAWLMYAENNDYTMCGPMTGNPRYDWVGPPRDLASDAPKTSKFTAEEEVRNGRRCPDMTGLSNPDNPDIRWLATHYPRKH